MLNSGMLQQKYNALYVELRRYLWDFEVVETIADLEVAIYTAFPDMDAIKQCIYDLTRYIADATEDDEELETALTELTELVYSEDIQYTPITVLQEALPQ